MFTVPERELATPGPQSVLGDKGINKHLYSVDTALQRVKDIFTERRGKGLTTNLLLKDDQKKIRIASQILRWE